LQTKAALHSYVLSQRYKLKNTPVRVVEIAPPWVQTDLLGSSDEPQAMPLPEFIKETIERSWDGCTESFVRAGEGSPQ